MDTTDKERSPSPTSTATETSSDSDPHDDRPFVKDLLAEHSKVVESVRNTILADETVGKPLWNPERYDDIWILRYVLTHKNAKAAAKAALKTMKFRDEMKMNDDLGDIRHRLRSHGMGPEKQRTTKPLPHWILYESFCSGDAAFVCQPDPDRGIVIYCDIGDIDMEGIASAMSEQQMKEYVLYSNEAMFQVLDETTRRTGRLTKLVKIVDVGKATYRKLNGKYSKRDGAISKELEDYYPQLLGTFFAANPPGWLNAVWVALRPFFPKRFVEKVDFLPSNASKKLYPPILKYVSEKNLPQRYGGKNKEWPLTCISETMTIPSESLEVS